MTKLLMKLKHFLCNNLDLFGSKDWNMIHTSRGALHLYYRWAFCIPYIIPLHLREVVKQFLIRKLLLMKCLRRVLPILSHLLSGALLLSLRILLLVIQMTFSCSLKRREKHFIHLQIFFFYYANLASRHNSQNADLCQLRLFTWGF